MAQLDDALAEDVLEMVRACTIHMQITEAS
jgi:hypothetical protein